MKNHLWRGQWLDDDELAAHLPTLADTLAADLERPFPLAALLDAAHALGAALRAGGPLRESLQDSLKQDPDARDADVQATLDSVAAFLDRPLLETKLKRELGGTDPFTPRRVGYTDHRFESWAPLGLLVHVAPGNVSSVAPLSVIEGLLAGNINFLKCSSGATQFAPQLLAALIAQDPTGSLAPFIYSAQIPSRDTERLRALFSLADGIAAWGGEAAVAAVRDMAPAGCRVVDWGHKISFACLTAEMRDDADSLAAIARDVCTIDQQACSSPQCLFVEVPDRESLFAFAERFAGVLAQVSPTVARRQPDTQEQAEITTVTEMARLEAVYSDTTRVYAAPEGDWRVLAEDNPALRASPLFRTLWIKPLHVDALTRTLRPLRAWLQTAGLACSLPRYAELSSRLIAAGVSRVTRLGEQLGGYAGAPHDGVYALQRYTRRVSCEMTEAARGISSFHELAEPVSPLAPNTPILDKNGFLELASDPRHAHLFFKSGGSSGAPKLAVYSWEDYDTQMRAAADGLYAAGLDPTRDRTMNLFFSGHLYGSFISFWSILEHLGAVQYPMGAIDDLHDVARIIVDQKIDTLLGMPFYLNRLFTEQAEILRNYGGVKKLFFGGEHFNARQREQLKQDFGIEIIRAAAYGSNDAGPLGYQCAHVGDAEYHVLATQYLEILALDADQPAAPGEPGRLIFTSLARHGQKVQRYDVGDLGRWLPGRCACGRLAPRVELMGRHGDLFRAPYFFNYRTIAHVLSDHGEYAGPVQLVLEHNGKTHQICVRLQADGGLTADQARALLLQHYPDLHEFVEGNGLTHLTAELVAPDGFVTTATTGKFKSIVDLRNPA